MTYAYRRGKGAKRRVMHLVKYGPLGTPAGVFCGTDYPLNTTINVPIGLKVCRKCRKAVAIEREVG